MNDSLVELHLTAGDRHVVGARYPTMSHFASPLNTTSANSLYFNDSTADWVFEATRKLDALARLQAGWDSHRGLPLQATAKGLTLNVLNCLKTQPLPTPAVVLGSGGSVHLEWKNHGKELELGLGDGSAIDYVKVSPEGEIEEGKEKTWAPTRIRDLTAWLLES